MLNFSLDKIQFLIKEYYRDYYMAYPCLLDFCKKENTRITEQEKEYDEGWLKESPQTQPGTIVIIWAVMNTVC